MRNNHRLPSIIYFFPVIVMFLFISPFAYDYIRVNFLKVSCGRFFFQCKNSWTSEYNSSGQLIVVHYRVNFRGERLKNEKLLGCDYDGTPQQYQKLIEQIPDMKLVMENETYIIYADSSHGQLVVDKLDKPYVPDLDNSEYYRRKLNKLIYEGTECDPTNLEK